MSLRVFAAVLEWIQQLRVDSCQASQVLGVDLIRFTLVSVDEPCLPGVGHQDLVATLLQYPAHPGRVGTGLDCYAHRRPLGGEASPEGLGASAQPTLLHNLAAYCVDEAEVGVFVAEIHSCCHQWLVFASIHGGPILLPFWASEPVEHLQTQGYCVLGGRPSHLIFGGCPKGEVRRIPIPRTPLNRFHPLQAPRA
jgi:hypothetical protein